MYNPGHCLYMIGLFGLFGVFVKIIISKAQTYVRVPSSGNPKIINEFSIKPTVYIISRTVKRLLFVIFEIFQRTTEQKKN